MNLDVLWYGTSRWRYALWPISQIYCLFSVMRREAYRRGWLVRYRAPVPVVVVGNLCVGGAGKTPLTIALVEWLQRKGLRPGVISRGYGGDALSQPVAVTRHTHPHAAGDEPVLIARCTSAPVVVFPDRRRAIEHLLTLSQIDLIIADDGLQHYALERDIEIVVVDANRLHGNGLCLPAGPLREPVSRLDSADFVVFSGATEGTRCHSYERHIDEIENLADGRLQCLSAWRGKSVHAVAGIADPDAFFESLHSAGLVLQKHTFADHHRYSASDLAFGDLLPVIMTEKDAIKCRSLTGVSGPLWQTRLRIRLAKTLVDDLADRLSVHFPALALPAEQR